MPKLDKRAADALIWALLLTAPFWLAHVGGYVELGSRVLIYALAAMALNFLLGYTGVLSFGHAAYFGLGAYGTALTIKLLYPEHAARHAGRNRHRHRRRGDYRPADRAAQRRLFRHVHHRLRPGVLLHRLSMVFADPWRRRRQRLASHSHRPRASPASTSSTTTRRFTISCWWCSRCRSVRWRFCCARRSAARCWRYARTSAAPASSAFRSTSISGCRG